MIKLSDKRTSYQLVCDLCGKLCGEYQIGDQMVSDQSLTESVDDIMALLQHTTSKSFGLDLIKWAEWEIPLHENEREQMVLQFIKVKGRIIEIEKK